MPHLVISEETRARDFVLHNEYQVLQYFIAERNQSFMTTLRWEDLSANERKEIILHNATCVPEDCNWFGGHDEDVDPQWSPVLEIWRRVPKESWDRDNGMTTWEFWDFAIAPDRVAPADKAIWRQIKGQEAS